MLNAVRKAVSSAKGKKIFLGDTGTFCLCLSIAEEKNQGVSVLGMWKNALPGADPRRNTTKGDVLGKADLLINAQDPICFLRGWRGTRLCYGRRA